jgi:DUF971 family protein
MNSPQKIKLNKEKQQLEITWDNDTTHYFPLQFLRDESPDATNKGETILWKHYEPQPQGPDKPGKYEIDKIEMVGNYAMQITWKDGYDYGIYSWHILFSWGEQIEINEILPKDFGEHKHSNND